MDQPSKDRLLKTGPLGKACLLKPDPKFDLRFRERWFLYGIRLDL